MMRILTAAALLFFAAATSAATPRDNDASCDIGLYPAATLLLPYFEVDVDTNGGATTLFTVTNTGHLPQVAHVTLWTDRAYPVIDFNLYLTGYDVQSINLYDVIARGRLAPDLGTGSAISPVGELSGNSALDREFDNPLVNEADCYSAAPVQLTPPFITRMRLAFTEGRFPAFGARAACTHIGDIHENAVGYATIDVVSVCSVNDPTRPDYFTRDLLFDNVLIGDYQQIDGRDGQARSSPMVHIRAIPEGGTPQTRAANPAQYASPFPRTFYSRFQPAATPTADGRQPLPAVFAARWLSGGPAGYDSSFKIWREAFNAARRCEDAPRNARMDLVELVRFDEEENPTIYGNYGDFYIELPATSRLPADDDLRLPNIDSNAFAGWMYFNLDEPRDHEVANQAWIVVSMAGRNGFSADHDAVALGNGCTPPTAQSSAIGGARPIGPAPNVNP